MKTHLVRTHRSAEEFPQEDHLAWKIAEVATDSVEVADATSEHDRQPDHRQRRGGCGLPGAPPRGECACTGAGAPVHARVPPCSVSAARSRRSGPPGPTASRCGNSTSTTRSSPPSTRTPVTTSRRSSPSPSTPAVRGRDLIRGLATGYEIQIDLVRAICLHEHKIDHVAHLGPSAAAGIGTLLGLDTETIYQAIGQALHLTTATRQSRKGEISSWKAYAPALAGKVAVEAVDRAMRGEGAPSPIWEGEDGVIAWLLGGPDTEYHVPLPGPGEAKRAILDTLHQGALRGVPEPGADRPRPPDACSRSAISTRSPRSSCTPVTTPTSSSAPAPDDPQKFDPTASRETLDHSVMYIFAVALQDGTWHHEHSYAPERAQRPDTIELWNKISTARRSRMDAPLPLDRSGREGVRCSRRDHLEERRGHRRRARGGRCAPARRPSVRPRSVRREVPHPRRGRHRAERTGPLPRRGASAPPN